METIAMQQPKFNAPTWFRNISVRVLGEKCTAELMDNLNYKNSTCMKLALSKGLSFGIILGAMIVKVPQILKIVLSRSTVGLSGLSYILETLAATITFAYNFRAGNPFSTYGETLFMTLQNIIILMLLGLYRGETMKMVLLMSIYSVFISSLLIPTYFDDTAVRSLQALTIPLMMVSRLPQIWTIWKHKSTGQLSALTIFLIWAGSMARVFTSFHETRNDHLLLLGFALAAALNTIILTQIVYYWKSSPAHGKAMSAGSVSSVSKRKKKLV